MKKIENAPSPARIHHFIFLLYFFSSACLETLQKYLRELFD